MCLTSSQIDDWYGGVQEGADSPRLLVNYVFSSVTWDCVICRKIALLSDHSLRSVKGSAESSQVTAARAAAFTADLSQVTATYEAAIEMATSPG